MKNNVVKKAVGIVTDNIGIKILAVVVSCGLWFIVNSINDPTTRKPYNNIPVEIINEDKITSEGKVYEVLENTNFVNVTVYGKDSILSEISREDIKAVADMSELTFMNTVSIQVYSTKNNSDLDFRTNIDTMKLSIEDRKSIQKTINAYTTGELEEGYVVGKVDTSPNVVRFSGPISVIDQIDHVDAVANVEGYSSDISTSVELKIYDSANNEIKNNSIKMNISTVNVGVTILATKEVPLSFTVQGEPRAGYIVSPDIVSTPEKVTLAGRSSVLDGISKITVADPLLNVEDRTESLTSVVNISKYLPSGVQFADNGFSGNASVTVGVEKLVTKQLDIPARNFAAGNKPDGLKLTLREVESKSTYSISISGTQAAIDAIDAENIIGVIDMNALSEAMGIQEWAAGFYQGSITFNLPDNVKLAEDYKMTVVLEEVQDTNN